MQLRNAFQIQRSTFKYPVLIMARSTLSQTSDARFSGIFRARQWKIPIAKNHLGATHNTQYDIHTYVHTQTSGLRLSERVRAFFAYRHQGPSSTECTMHTHALAIMATLSNVTVNKANIDKARKFALQICHVQPFKTC